MAVSEGGIGTVSTLVGGLGGLRRVAGFKIVLVDNATLFLILLLAGPTCQVELPTIHSSQPLFLLAPGPTGFARVAVVTWPFPRPWALQILLSWLGPTPWPCVEQKPPGIHFPLTAAWSCEIWLLS